MFFMDNKNQAYQVVDADQFAYEIEFDRLHDENYILSDGTWDIDEVKQIISELPLMQQFKLYENITMDTVSNCLMDYSDVETLDEVDTDTMQDFNDEFYFNYLDENIDGLRFYRPGEFDMCDLLEWLNNEIKTFNYCHIYGYCQGDECYLFNNQGFEYDEKTKNYYTCVLYGGLVEIDSLDDNGDIACQEGTLSNDYSLEYDQDKITAYMKDTFQALPAKEIITRKIVLA